MELAPLSHHRSDDHSPALGDQLQVLSVSKRFDYGPLFWNGDTGFKDNG